MNKKNIPSKVIIKDIEEIFLSDISFIHLLFQAFLLETI